MVWPVISSADTRFQRQNRLSRSAVCYCLAVVQLGFSQPCPCWPTNVNLIFPPKSKRALHMKSARSITSSSSTTLSSDTCPPPHAEARWLAYFEPMKFNFRFVTPYRLYRPLLLFYIFFHGYRCAQEGAAASTLSTERSTDGR